MANRLNQTITRLSLYKKLFKQTAVYGIATVFPRMLGFILVPFYIEYFKDASEYGVFSTVFAYLIFFNVVLSYGMETTFFRFFNKEENKENVISTAQLSLLFSTVLFFIVSWFSTETISQFFGFEVSFIQFTIGILTLDALVVLPFSRLRAQGKTMKYAGLKIANVTLNLILNVFFLVFLPKIAAANPNGFFASIYIENYQVTYVFISLLVASAFTFLALLPSYFSFKWKFDIALYKKMLRYSWPILIAGLAFAINEQFDKILLEALLDPETSKEVTGIYSACYKLGLFMVLFRTAYSLGVEPFFFSHAKEKNAPQTYATITKYFVIIGSLMLLVIVVFADVLKVLLIPKEEFWGAMDIVPLIILANFFLGIYTNLSVWYKLIDKTYIGAIISVVGAIITLAVNVVFIPKYSFYASAAATLLAYGSMMVLSYYLGRKKYPIPYDFKAILTYLVLAITLSAVSFYVTALRTTYVFGIVAIIGFCYYIFRQEKELIHKILKR